MLHPNIWKLGGETPYFNLIWPHAIDFNLTPIVTGRWFELVLLWREMFWFIDFCARILFFATRIFSRHISNRWTTVQFNKCQSSGFRNKFFFYYFKGTYFSLNTDMELHPEFDSLIAQLNLLSLASISSQPAADTSFDSCCWDQTDSWTPSSSSCPSSSEKCGSSPPHGETANNNNNSRSISSCIIDNKMQSMRVNGRKIIGPPVGWVGEAPSIDSELFLKRIPKDISEMKLLELFEKFGPVYHLRLMVDFADQNRGFGYVHFFHKSDAAKAMDVLQHFFIRPFHTLHLEKSYNKCRLFVTNFPREKSVTVVKAVLHEMFPELSNVVIYKCHSDEGNRGFAFVDFPTHDAAIRAKKLTSTGRCRLFDRDVKVVWANPESTADTGTDAVLDDVRTLFVRNVHMSLNNRDIFQVLSQFVHRTEVRKVARVRDLAFIEFFEREAAERVKVNLDGERNH